MPSAISLRHVVKNYQRGKEKVAVLHGLDLEIAEGEFISLMGPSGSGKTTILNLVGGLDRVTSGEVIVAEAGEDPIGMALPSLPRPGVGVERGEIEVTQSGRVVDIDTARGAIRLRKR